MSTTTVSSGNTATNQDVTSGNTLDILSGGTANGSTIESGGTETVESGGTDTNALVLAGGLETVSGTATGDDVAGTLNVNATGVVNNATVESGGAINLTIKGAQANNITVKAGGLLAINGNAAVNGVTLQGGTFELQSPKAETGATGSINFVSGFNSTLQIDQAQPTVPTFGPTLTGFAAGDTVDLKGLTFAGASLSTTTNGANTTVTVTGGASTGSQTFTFSNVAPGSLALAQDAAGGTEIVACYVSGTAIRTTHGDVAVENLQVGHFVLTATGEPRAIRWIGHRTIDCSRSARPNTTIPVRIAAHAFAPNRPSRDLFVSPGHAIGVTVMDEVLIPAVALINGATITQDVVETVTYWHVELDSHDMLVAENLPAESYLDMDNRGFFVESASVSIGAVPDAAPVDHDAFCRPFFAEGTLVDLVRDRLRARALDLGWSLGGAVGDDLHIVADGTRITPVLERDVARFSIPADVRTLSLVSRTSIPAEMGLSADGRVLGVCLDGLEIEDGAGDCRDYDLGDAGFATGFHGPETFGGVTRRWTNGRAILPADLWSACAGPFTLALSLAVVDLPRWVAPRPALGMSALGAAA
jgi:autotransporter passenger strand-loop-strand repeat protein